MSYNIRYSVSYKVQFNGGTTLGDMGFISEEPLRTQKDIDEVRKMINDDVEKRYKKKVEALTIINIFPLSSGRKIRRR